MECLIIGPDDTSCNGVSRDGMWTPHVMRMALHMVCVVCSASRDGQILYNDVRKPQHVVASSYYHKLEVCGLDWSPDGTKLASGANDNMVCIWNASNSKDPEQILRGHTAAVKVCI